MAGLALPRFRVTAAQGASRPTLAPRKHLRQALKQVPSGVQSAVQGLAARFRPPAGRPVVGFRPVPAPTSGAAVRRREPLRGSQTGRQLVRTGKKKRRK